MTGRSISAVGILADRITSLNIGDEAAGHGGSLGIALEVGLKEILHHSISLTGIPIIHLSKICRGPICVPVILRRIDSEINFHRIDRVFYSFVYQTTIVDIGPGQHGLCSIAELYDGQHTCRTAGILNISLCKFQRCFAGILDTALSVRRHIIFITIPSISGFIIHHTAGRIHEQHHRRIAGHRFDRGTHLQSNFKLVFVLGTGNGLAGPEVKVVLSCHFPFLGFCQVIYFSALLDDLNCTTLPNGKGSDIEHAEAHHERKHQRYHSRKLRFHILVLLI